MGNAAPLRPGSTAHIVYGVETEALKIGTEPVAEHEERRRLLWLMAEYFKTLGFTDVKARLPGYVPPAVLAGTLEDHRPDLTCRQSDSAHTPTILEALPASMLEDPSLEHRWTLFSSAAKLYGAELHFVVPKWTPLGPGDQILKRRLMRLEINSHRIWTV